MSTASLKEMPLHTDMFLEHQYSTGWAKEKKKDKTDSIFKICSKSQKWSWRVAYVEIPIQQFEFK